MRRWAQADDEFVRTNAAALTPALIAAALGRTENAVQIRISKLGCSPDRSSCSWTPEEDAQLKRDWLQKPYEEIAAELRRHPQGVYARARRLDLPFGCPQGYESIKQAAARCGYDERCFYGILRTLRVQLLAANRSPGAKGKLTQQRYYVETDDATRATEEWAGRESVRAAARRRGVGPTWLRTRLVALFGEPAFAGPNAWRLPSDAIDMAMRLENVADCARRVGKDSASVWRRLVAAKVQRYGDGFMFLVLREDADRALAMTFPPGTFYAMRTAAARSTEQSAA